MANVQYYGTGRRKHSVARVRLVAGEGNIIVNGRAVEEYFNYETLIRDVKQPLVLTNNENKYDVIVKVEGGGFTGQAGAIRHGISRALLKADAELRSELKKAGFLCGRSCGACRIPRCDPGNDDKKIRKPDHKYPSIFDPVFLWNGLLWIEGTRGRAFAWCKNNRSHRAFCG